MFNLGYVLEIEPMGFPNREGCVCGRGQRDVVKMCVGGESKITVFV